MNKTQFAPRSRQKAEEEPPRQKKRRSIPIKGLAFLAAAPIALAVIYLTQMAPGLVPVPEEVTVPFPAATRFLEKVCAWSGEHPWWVAITGAGLLLPGAVSGRGRRYYIWLAILSSLALFFMYLSISAPIDRLIHTVEENLPPPRETPDFLPGKVRR